MSSVPPPLPISKLQTLANYAKLLAEIERAAAADELPMLAYLMGIAKLEAETQALLAADEHAARRSARLS
jgi:hypothetical protein